MSAQRSFLLLHGYGNHRPPEHWQHWLAGQLEAAGERVLYPQLPDPDSPVLGAWLPTLMENLAELSRGGASSGASGAAPDTVHPSHEDGTPDDGEEPGERIVLCHSLGCLLWFHAAPLIPAALRPDRLVLVAPPAMERVPQPMAGFEFPDGIDAAALHASVTVDLRIVCSDNDEDYNPQGAAGLYAEPLDVAVNLIPGGRHLTASDGYGPWPQMLAWCANPGPPVSPD